MSRFVYFLGGALVGAAGITAAALLHKENDNPLRQLGNIEDLGVDDLIGKLNRYVIKAHALSIICSSVVMKSTDLQATPIDLPGDDLLTRIGNMVGGTMTVVSRQWKRDALLDLKKEAEQLYTQYSGVFAKANTLLEQFGMGQISCKGIVFGKRDFSLNNELSNDDWILEFDALADTIRNFLNMSTTVAEQLIASLEKNQDENDAVTESHTEATA